MYVGVKIEELLTRMFGITKQNTFGSSLPLPGSTHTKYKEMKCVLKLISSKENSVRAVQLPEAWTGELKKPDIIGFTHCRKSSQRPEGN